MLEVRVTRRISADASPAQYALGDLPDAPGAAISPGGQGATAPAWRGLLRFVSGNNILAWADQAVVSAISFLALVMVGRWGGPSELGPYGIGLSFVALLLATQESLVTKPYTIQLHRSPRTPMEHAFDTLVLSLLLSAAAMFVAIAVALALSALHAQQKLVHITWALAGTIPFLLAREFARRFAFAHLKVSRALLLDMVVAAIAAIALAYFGWTGQLSAVTALSAMGFACAVSTVGWLFLARSEFAFGLPELRSAFQQSWGLGKWFLPSQVAIQGQGYITLWLTMVIAGSAVTGIYTACASIIAIANPVLYGLYNVLTPKSVRALRLGGGPGLLRQATFDSLLIVVVMIPFCAVIFWAGDDIIRLLYTGAEYSGHGNILAVLALAAAAGAVGVPASIAVAAAERARVVAFVVTATAILQVFLVWWLLTGWGLLGAAYGILIAEAVGSLGRWSLFLILLPQLGRLPLTLSKASNAEPMDPSLKTAAARSTAGVAEHHASGASSRILRPSLTNVSLSHID